MCEPLAPGSPTSCLIFFKAISISYTLFYVELGSFGYFSFLSFVFSDVLGFEFRA
jgi:hypothetical protein